MGGDGLLFFAHRFFRTRSVVGWMQLVDQVVLPPSLQMEMENRPKLARTRLITVPSSHSMSSVVPSQPYFVRRSEPAPKIVFYIYFRKMFILLLYCIISIFCQTNRSLMHMDQSTVSGILNELFI